VSASRLDAKTHSLVRLGALIAIDAAPPSYMWAVESALAHGATNEEIVGVLVAVMPSVGSGRVVSAAPRLSLALGYDVGAGLEDFGVESRP
jgi:alkylhydroperoxidase/carboxymuconolactone decarboxylase family protein YurZ